MEQDRIRKHLRSAYQLSDEKIAVVLPKFIETLTIHLASLESAWNAQDPVLISKTGHTLRGALLNLGLTDLADMAHQMEHHRQNPPQHEPGIVLLELRRAINQITAKT